MTLLIYFRAKFESFHSDLKAFQNKIIERQNQLIEEYIFYGAEAQIASLSSTFETHSHAIHEEIVRLKQSVETGGFTKQTLQQAINTSLNIKKQLEVDTVCFNSSIF